MPSRRRFLRRLGGAAGVGLLAATAGCTGTRLAESSGGGFESLPTPGMDAAAFETYVAEMRDEWGDHGVFGRSGLPDAPFEAAWSASFVTGPRDDDNRGYAEAAFALARYALGESEAGNRVDAWVLWGAARPTAETTDGLSLPGGIGPHLSVGVRGLGVGVSFEAPTSLVHYDPASDVSADRTDAYDVASGVLSGPRVSATVPVEAGLVRGMAPESWTGGPETGFDANEYAGGWEGRRDGPVSVTAVCTTETPADADPSSAATHLAYHVAAGGYL